MPADKVVFLVSFATVWAAFTWWTVKRFWRSPEDPRDARVSKKVRTYGVVFSILIALIVPDRMPMPPLTYWQQAGFFAVFSLPVGLWAGHFSMRIFHAFVDSHYS
jgi:4-amino-4-deoxy-L-arabinose transferase-like glycosyltransferase